MTRTRKTGLAALVAVALLCVWLWPLQGRRVLRSWHHDWQRARATGLFLDPEGLAIDPAGNVWVADEDRSEMFVLGPDGALLARGRSAPGADRLTAGDAMAVVGPGHVVAISDQYLVEIRLEGRELKAVKTFGRRGAGDGEFGDPEGLTRDPATGEFWLADENNRRVIVYDKDGRFVRHFGVDHECEGIALTPDRVYLGMSKAGWLSAYARDGRFLFTFGKGEVDEPDVVLLAPDGKSLYVTDNDGGKIVVFDLEGRVLRTIGKGLLSEPGGLAFDREGNLWVADGGHHRVQVLSPEGRPIRAID